MMRFKTFLLAGAAILGLSACVVVETGSTIGAGGTSGGFPTSNTPTTTAPQNATPAPFTPLTLRAQLAGARLDDVDTQIVLLPGGGLQGFQPNTNGVRSQVAGSWSVNGNSLCISITAPSAFSNCGNAEVRGNQLLWDDDNNPSTSAATLQLQR